MLKGLVWIACICIGILYPVAIYVGIKQGFLSYLILFLLVCFVLRLCMLKNKKSPFTKLNYLGLIGGSALLVLSLLFEQMQLVLAYPVLINSIFFLAFVYSLVNQTPMITMLASLKTELDDYAKGYTRKLTILWSVFFLFNGSIALYTVLIKDLDLWTLYNGLISYILIGLLLVGEFIFRIYIKRKHHA